MTPLTTAQWLDKCLGQAKEHGQDIGGADTAVVRRLVSVTVAVAQVQPSHDRVSTLTHCGHWGNDLSQTALLKIDANATNMGWDSGHAQRARGASCHILREERTAFAVRQARVTGSKLVRTDSS